METASPLCLVLTSWPADRPADELAESLIAAQLAACVSVLAPMTSHYRWAGAVERAEERPVVIKTMRTAVPALVERLRGLHPYEVPEIVVLDGQASAAYGAWVRDSVVAGG